MLRFRCPTCGTMLEVEQKEQAPNRPFCSDRCQMIDLHKWFNEEYRVSESVNPADLQSQHQPGAIRSPNAAQELDDE